jgi:predicted CXXCH cytochrome family protein
MRRIHLVFVMFVIALGGARAGDTACLGCHSMLQDFLSKDTGHPAMRMGCQTCHTDHAQSSSTDRTEHHLIAAPGELCITCHAEIVKTEFVHEPVKRDCTLCHGPHAGLKNGLRAQSNALCLECHLDSTKSKFETDGPVKLFGGQVTLPPRSFQNLRLLALRDDRGHPVSNHPVLRAQDADWPAVSCTVCHNPHGAEKSAALLVAEVENFALCQGCHK